MLEDVGRPFFGEDFDPDQRWHPYDTAHWEWYAVRVNGFSPSRDGWTEEELTDVVDWRWFSAAELEETPYEYEPPGLPGLLAAALETLSAEPAA
ncbi:hypothetical protein GCM10025866_32000 [Naasia aerilata]|uniref:Nudix hydrolase domain-containing protein n=1 Tax=Naasia aerilata TaxID=1162966 RepID=A0ABM8GFZ8_9MICO|nr:hypothetical protein GCM10025866_32000 [Naasia aerilata]